MKQEKGKNDCGQKNSGHEKKEVLSSLFVEPSRPSLTTVRLEVRMERGFLSILAIIQQRQLSFSLCELISTDI